MKIIDKIISNFKNSKSLYIGEKVTMSEHMIQTAMLAEKAKSNGDLLLGLERTIATLVDISQLNFSGGISTFIPDKFSGSSNILFSFAFFINSKILSRYISKIFILMIYKAV